jgi:hypothetical protein
LESNPAKQQELEKSISDWIASTGKRIEIDISVKKKKS